MNRRERGGLPARDVGVDEQGGVGAAVGGGGQPLFRGGAQMRPLVAQVAKRRRPPQPQRRGRRRWGGGGLVGRPGWGCCGALHCFACGAVRTRGEGFWRFASLCPLAHLEEVEARGTWQPRLSRKKKSEERSFTAIQRSKKIFTIV
jgi:hypothetical protein